MSFLDEYKRLTESETDNEFPEQMEHDGLSESDRGMYEEVLNKMRADMDKANDDMKKNAKSWGDVCHTTENGEIHNNTYALSEEMRKKNRVNYGSQQPIVNGDGTTRRVSEPFGLYIDGYRCPKCGRLMYEEPDAFVCGSCGYLESRAGRTIQFHFIDSSFVKTPFAPEDNERMNAMFRRANMQNK
jgi:rubrerythrin